ncbi:hypothetical protein C2845_PM10G06240 [Panicum miliaceum]|uniref:FAE domain-containing protein n=1 Tax=Panicum miliaceum TaxID=4540 RepID=A0A3L6PI66_PANMI|nr:hypothetical protein C2845_PM10G06240 [Panicum miliaceum]
MNSPPSSIKRYNYSQLVINNSVLTAAVLTGTIFLLKAAQLGPAQLLAWFHSVRHAHLFSVTFLAIALGTLYLMQRSRSVYLVDYTCFRHTSDCRIPLASFVEHARQVPSTDDKSIQFMKRMLENSGIGDQSYLPTATHYIPPSHTLSDARDEAEQVMFSSIDDLFARTGISAEAVDIVVTNCTVFSPVPSLADMIVSKYKLRSDVRSVHISGMGCSAGMIAVEAVKSLLQVAPQGAHALVVSTEIVSFLKFYTGRNLSMLLPNVLFRMGGAAVLLSTSRSKSRFKLMHTARTITAAQDRSYQCAFQQEDDKGEVGVNLSRDLVAVAGDTLQANVTAIGSLVLPLSEQLQFVLSLIARTL